MKKTQENITISSVENLKKSELTDRQTNDDFIVYVTNMCNWVVTAFKDEAGRWTNCSIGKNCNVHDYQQCVAGNHMTPLFVTNCHDRTFQFSLKLYHPRGYTAETNPVTVQPDCHYYGTVLGLDIPDPQ